MSTPIPVEVFRRSEAKDIPGAIWLSLCMTAIRTLFVWWAVASYFPQLGLTYWGLVLPVYAITCVFGQTAHGREWKRKI